jgi:NADH:ubiquinone oxidoreductase subunit F (NADH-binding)
VCTITGDVQRAGVGEVEMGTPLRDVIQAIAGGPREGHRIKAVMPGVSTGLLTGDQLDTPVSYEGLAAAGSGLGSAGFVVFDDTVDMTAVAAGASRFLAIESCGQCVPCKIDGLALSDLLDRLCSSTLTPAEMDKIRRLASTVGERARCSLATQHQDLIGSIIERFGAELEAHVDRYGKGAIEPILIAELKDIQDGIAVVDEHHRQKQADWSFGTEYSGKVPAELFGDHRGPLPLDDA